MLTKIDDKMIIAYNPYDGKEIQRFKTTQADDLKRIVDKSRLAQKEWAELSINQRIKIIEPIVNIIFENSEDIIHSLVTEIGMPITEARLSTTKLLERIEFFISKTSEYIKTEEIKLDNSLINKAYYAPVGVVGCIMPWNHPFTIPFWSIVPALIAGNAIVYKPSELTLTVAQNIDMIFSNIDIPHGLFSTIYGEANIGRALCASPEISMISFAGSIKIAKKVFRESSDNMKKLVIESGGKDALIIGEVKDKENLSKKILSGALRHAGQLCSSVKRVYVLEKDYDEYVECLSAHIGDFKVGDPRIESTVVGPLKTYKQIKKIEEHLLDAVQKGAKIVTGGKDIKGNLFQATIVKDVNPEMKIIIEENFGPIIPLVKVKSLEHAVDYTNDSQFGLNASIWDDNAKKAIKLAEKIDVGTVTINMLPSSNNYCTWHGIKLSGIGNVLSKDGIRQFTNKINIRYSEA